MDIEEMREAKRQAEKNILYEVQKFQAVTGLVTTFIDLTIAENVSGEKELIACEIHARL